MINRGLWPIVMFLLLIASWAYAGTIKVNSLEDANARDDAITLREAILLSEGSLIFNVLAAAEQDQVSPPVGRGIADTINFSISGTMMPTSGLPNITDDGTVIDASSQWSGVWPEGQPGVILDGTNAGNVAGLIIGGSANCHIRGLFITNFSTGVFIGGGQFNTVGGIDTGNRNIISGNNGFGILIGGLGTANNIVKGNYIGTDATGTVDLGNASDGVIIDTEAQSNTIGGATPEERNIISGNNGVGVSIYGSASNNIISGNYIGTDVIGTADLENSAGGLAIGYGAQSNTIGGATSGERNIISGNKDFGVLIGGSGTANNMIKGNYIGTDVTGGADLGNSGNGVVIVNGAQWNVIGGTGTGGGNIIAFNDWGGVSVEGTDTDFNRISSNSIHDNAGSGIDLSEGGNDKPGLPDIIWCSLAGDILTISSDGAGANATIEVFKADSWDQEGETFLGSLTADEGGKLLGSLPIAGKGVCTGDSVVATTTHTNGNTSEFSFPQTVSASPPPVPIPNKLESDQPKPSFPKHIGASYMTFWGVGDGSWELPRIYTPSLGSYPSYDPKVAASHITTARRYGINLFYLDFGWVTPKSRIDLAAQKGLLRAENVDLINVCITYFPDAVAGQDWSQGPDRLKSDFDYLAENYFTHASYLRIGNRLAVIVNNLQVYWDELGISETNALFSELKSYIAEKYSMDLYLVGAVWHDSSVESLRGNPFDALTVWGNLWCRLGNDPDRTYSYLEYSTACRSVWSNWRSIAVSNNLDFVPLIKPGFDNSAYLGQAHCPHHYVIDRDLDEFRALCEYANSVATSGLNMILLFTWNDFNESTTIEPANEYGFSYLEVVDTTFGWQSPIEGDVSGDGTVNVWDIILVAQHFGEDMSISLYPNPDVNGDGIVNILDIILVARHFGEVYSPAAPSKNIWKVDQEHIPLLTKIYNIMEDSPSSDPDFLATKSLLQTLISIAKISTEAFQNYPNPFNPDTWIPYQLREDSDVVIKIYTSTGRLVRTLNLGHKPAGIYKSKEKAAYWDGRNEAGEKTASGVYFYRIQAGNFVATKKLVMIE